ncbi:3-deoxy-D-manno-octulosonic acid transferase [Prosthecochloris sp. ZM_2]|uniref:3-deoxy-D-manno-octulosonic acid transferase n=1 Tax=Prosthecochloris sp. ZM_2 TaxID=2045206 RepID=UPI000DF77DC8|nr:glycosyltransferase N-terminal domain-containing protein [Prosthecochloris sp. ZM_2]RNA65252.1 3-deoxy-D-manno-octulosonic acid transferase [Prosthecochloris sp. ZM_2]
MKAFAVFYNICIPVIAAAARIAAVVSPRLRTWFRVRTALFDELERSVVTAGSRGPTIWFHAASAGEFEQARPLIGSLKTSVPDCRIVVTFQSPSGYDLRRNYPDADLVVYHPADTLRNARRFVRLVQPDAVVVMRYDFWFNHLACAKRSGAALILAGAVLRNGSVYQKPVVQAVYRRIFSLFDRIYTVSDTDKERFEESFGLSGVVTAGDPRCDQVMQRKNSASISGNLKTACANRTVLVAGSTWKADEDILLPALNGWREEIAVIIVPHETDTGNIRRLERELQERNLSYSLFSQGIDDAFSPGNILVVDTRGMLAELYSIASIAYIGGGFGINVHNTLEPAVYAIPVLFGPNHQNSREAGELIEAGGAMEITSSNDLRQRLRSLVRDPSERRRTGDRAGRFVTERLGATAMICSGILEEVDSR